MQKFEDVLKRPVFSEQYEKYSYYKKIWCADEIALFLSFYTYGGSYSSFGLEAILSKIRKRFKERSVYMFLGEKIKEVLEKYIDPEKGFVDSFNILKYHPEFMEFFESENRKQNYYSNNNGVIRKMGNITGSALFGSSKEKKYGGQVLGVAPKVRQVESNVGLSSDANLYMNEDAEFDCASNLDGIEMESIEASVPMTGPTVTKQVSCSNIEKIAGTDSYHQIVEQGFKETYSNPFSSFKMTTNNASIGILMNNLNNNRYIDKSMVRIEEVLNGINFNLKKPKDRKFNYVTRLCNKPNSNNKLFFVGVQAKDINLEDTYQNVTVLLDVSGSMSSQAEVTQAALVTLFMQLKEKDIISLVTYSSKDSVVFENKKIGKNITLLEFIDYLFDLKISGCTYGSKGIETAYEIASKNYKKDSINRVVLLTDGDLNFGINSNDGLQKLIEEKKKTGVFLTVIGTGLLNYKDDKLEVLSKYGNGNYCVVNNIFDISYNLKDRYTSMMFTIAKDVKAEVEFNPYFVKSYRLLRYENRGISHAEFKDDSVVSEPFGSGSYGVALYELEMNEPFGEISTDLKYSKVTVSDNENLCTIRVRYKELDASESSEQNFEIKYKESDLNTILYYAYSIFVLCEIFRDSEYVTREDFASIKEFGERDDIKELDRQNYGILQYLINNVNAE